MDTTIFDPTQSSGPEVDTNSTALASYYQSLDAHNYGNGNFAYTDPSTWGTGLSNVGKFVVGAAVSGLDGTYNSFAAGANWLGADVKERDTYSDLAGLDSSLGDYYVAHQGGVDLAGFVASSLVPGLAGVKLLNAGQKVLRGAVETGKIGGNLGKAIGLLTPQADIYAAKSAAQISQAQASFSLINANTLKALAAGVTQNTLEGAAFETAVVATNFKSPILSEADGWDIAKDIAIGAATGGIIGGAFSAASTFGTIRKAIKPADLAEKPYTYISELGSGSSAADKIIVAANDLSHTPVAPTTGDAATKLARLRSAKIDTLNQNIRTGIHDLTTADDKEFGNQVADIIHGMDAQQIEANFTHAEEMGRLSSKLEAETSEARFLKQKYPAGASIDKKVGYVKLLGENAGGIAFDAAPAVHNLADVYKNSQDVRKAIDGYKFNEKTPWNPAAEGVDHLQAEARYWWADNVAKVKDGMTLDEHDIPMLERVYGDWSAQLKGKQILDQDTPLSKISLIGRDGYRYDITNADDLLRSLRRGKQEVANYLLAGKAAGTTDTIESIAKTVNVRQSYLQGQQAFTESDDIFARQYFAKQYTDSLVAKGLRNSADGLVDTTMLPTWAKIGYNIKPLLGQDGMLLSGMAYQYAKQQLLAQQVRNVFTKYAGDTANSFVPLDSSDVLYANRTGAGPGLFTFASANYGNTAAKAEAIGHATSLLQKKIKGITSDTINPLAYGLLNNSKAAIEFQAVHNLVASTSEHYVLDATGQNLIPRALQRYQAQITAGAKNLTPPTIQEGAPRIIPLVNQETRDAVAAHIKLNGDRISSERELRAVQGLDNQKDASTFYPIRPNPKDYNHFAFVVDPTVAGGSAGHITMIHAADGSTLEQLIDKVPGEYKVITKGQSEAFHKAIQDYDFDRTLHENFINPSLRRAGINSQFFQQTDAQKIANDWLQDHLRRDDVLVREMVNGLYEPQFQELRRLGDQYTGVETSKYAGSYKFAENAVKNPYLNIVKTSLNISQASEYPLLQGLNTIVDRTFTNAMNTVKNLWDSTKSPEDLEKINSALQEYGVRTAFQDSATNLLANHPAGKGALSTFVRRANSILSNLTLGLDPLNAINNAVGANVLLGSETKSIVRAIQAGNSNAVGALAQIKDISLPGVGDAITAPSKLIASAMRDFVSEDSPALKEFYTRNGWMSNLRDQFRSMLDDFTLNGSENAATLNNRINAAFAKAKDLSIKGQTLSGNKLAEEFNRFVAARVMQKISDVAVQHGIIGEADQIGYINSFVNRTQGNILASQRPIIFQGPVGQAIGLFQSYQFNLMQQMFRHISEGDAKDAAMLLGMQSTLYGLNGLPAFNYINTHILGTLSGNPNHTDAYSATYGIFGKQVGDFLLYGLPSNLLATNLYSRGDINPRQVTVIPTNPADIPFVSAFTSLFTNLKDMSSRIAGGGNVWETILQGIEHNGLSRPLAGVAQELQSLGPGGYAFSTSRKGTILGTNDLFSLASISRLAGGRPLDESIANDATYRMSAYQAADSARRDNLNEAIKTSVIAGFTPSDSSLDKFAAGYAALGGDTKRFNSYMLRQITAANTPQAEKIIQKLKSPYAQNMQEIMGGRDPFANLGY